MANNSQSKLSVVVRLDLRKKLEALAAREDLDLSKLVRRALREHVKANLPVRRSA